MCICVYSIFICIYIFRHVHFPIYFWQVSSPGSYGGITYSGAYGDLKATTVAVLMHSEARAQTSESNGALREPYLKAGFRNGCVTRSNELTVQLWKWRKMAFLSIIYLLSMVIYPQVCEVTGGFWNNHRWVNGSLGLLEICPLSELCVFFPSSVFPSLDIGYIDSFIPIPIPTSSEQDCDCGSCGCGLFVALFVLSV